MEPFDLLGRTADHQLQAQQKYQESQEDDNSGNEHQKADDKFENDIQSAAFQLFPDGIVSFVLYVLNNGRIGRIFGDQDQPGGIGFFEITVGVIGPGQEVVGDKDGVNPVAEAHNSTGKILVNYQNYHSAGF